MAAEAFARMRWTTFGLAPAEIARIAAVPEVVKVNRAGIAGSVSRARLRANATGADALPARSLESSSQYPGDAET
jgi:hypothetical protein